MKETIIDSSCIALNTHAKYHLEIRGLSFTVDELVFFQHFEHFFISL